MILKILNSVLPLLSTALCLTATYRALAQDIPSLSTPVPTSVSAGNQIILNGRTLPGAWLQPTATSKGKTYLSDGAVKQLIGIDLLNSSNPGKQPIQWFSGLTSPLVLNTNLSGGYRYLDITQLALKQGWKIQASGNTLVISTPPSQLKNIRLGQQPKGDRVVLDLDMATPWQVRQELPVKKVVDPDEIIPKSTTPPNREWTVTFDGIADPALLQRYNFQPTTPPIPASIIQKVEVVNNQTIVRLSVPFGQSVQVSTIPQPNRLVIDIQPEAMVTKSITWAQGLQWRQQFVNLGTDRFPVVWLDINPRTVGLSIKPIITNPQTLTGSAPIMQTAQNYLAVAAINGGYFNRNNKLPLGAIRRDNQWLSGPILNRGAIAWNNNGQFYFDRLTLTETLITSNNQRLPISLLNTGYVQRGIARYTPAWGNTYTPLSDNETIVVVENNQVINQLAGSKSGITAIPIPQNGYLLTFRSEIPQLPIGTKVSLTSTTTTPEFSRYPHIIGAGPLLVQNRQIVLDGLAEKFNPAFMKGQAVRSSICTTSTGSLMIAAVHSRAGGGGPTLAEQAKLMQTMGCINALNLDGGSSTSLYLSGQLLDRSPNTAARVHNGIGIFLEAK
ncbi:MAG: phosphodiester glycosidase family protein [Dolichospermum sp. DET50]|nr:phosphodiester glycosidase family protein [Dolichospermum sp. DET66]MBS3035612.1 phosphodiester glycosidase family protein [Dolichospermum sp. DET67]MBS3040814.1 phosphodiester glycosidase family protein [Dolichospermum sp. DET50]QSX67930.1 MAG: phosphodiester glycosidase family protein [Dolichospermum sp. DET69]